MIINLTPQRRDDTLVVVKSGDVLTLNGDVVDLSGIPDGATLPASAIDNEFFFDKIERIDGELHISLFLPHGKNPQSHVAFPEPIINPPDGEIDLPKDVSDGDD